MLDYEKLALQIYGRRYNAPAGGDVEVGDELLETGPAKDKEYIDGWLVKDTELEFRAIKKVAQQSEGPVGPPESVWPASGSVTSEFKLARMHPKLNVVKPHLAMDIANPLGGEVVASRAGRVVSVLPSQNGTNQLIVHNSDGSSSGYAHTTPNVKVGQMVEAGEVIGFTDLSGPTTGPHLHYTFSRSRERRDRINPRESLPRTNNYPKDLK